MQLIEEQSCIRFQPKTGSDQDFVHIYTDEKASCWADDHYTRRKGQHTVHLHQEYCMVRVQVTQPIL